MHEEVIARFKLRIASMEVLNSSRCTDSSVSLDDWLRALSAPKSELPELNEAAKSNVAREFNISGDEYARSELAGPVRVKGNVIALARLGRRSEQRILDRWVSSEYPT